MAKQAILSKRFQELAEQLDAVEATKIYQGGTFAGDVVDDQVYTNWKLKTRHLLSIACGEGSAHYRDFIEREKLKAYTSNYENMLQLRAVFEAAREDYEGGYLNSVRSLIQADVFGNELEQAQELFKGGYHQAAAVIAGVVLETTLRQLCDNHGIPHGNLNKMNADLTKAGQYSLLVQKRITALSDIRNNAAHGHPELFTKADVADMISKVESFVIEQL